jgi:hypothetical protein
MTTLNFNPHIPAKMQRLTYSTHSPSDKAAAHLQATSTLPSPTPTDTDMVEGATLCFCLKAALPRRGEPERWHLRLAAAAAPRCEEQARRRIHMPNPGRPLTFFSPSYIAKLSKLILY